LLHKASPEARAHVTLDFALEEVALPIAVAIPCGVLRNELVANAREHTFPGCRAPASSPSRSRGRSAGSCASR
jgi:two-component sensor histidine kinase